MKIFLRVLWFISGICFCMMGCYCLFNVKVTLLSLSWVISFAILFHGITSIVTFFYIREEFGSSWVLVDGIVSLIFGTLLLCNESIVFVASLLPWLFSLWLLLKGITQIVCAFEYKKIVGNIEYALMTVGILSLIFGLIMLLHPYVAAVAMSIIIGMYLIIIGIAFIMSFFKSQKFEKILK